MTVQDSERLGPLFTQYVQTVGVANLSDEEAQHLRKFVSWCGLDIKIAAIYPHQLQSYLEQVTGSAADPKPCASALRRFFAYALKTGWVESNPATGLRITETQHKERSACRGCAGREYVH